MKVTKILALRSNPTDTSVLRLDEEIRSIQEELERAKYGNRFEFINAGAVRVDDLSRSLLKHKPTIVHFSGHGTSRGLVLEDDAGLTQIVSTEALHRLFQWGRNTIKCVVLNACYSQVQAEAIHQQIDCVIGMNVAIGDRAAIQFAAKFYQALAEAESFQSAYNYACTALDLSGSPESSIPKLLNRIEGDDPLAIVTPELATPESGLQAVEPQRAQQSQSIGNITISGSNNPFNAIQAGENVILNQRQTQTSESDSNGSALAALSQLKQAVIATAELEETEKEMVAVPIRRLETELQKPQPDYSTIDRIAATLKKALDGVSTLRELVSKVVTLLAKAEVGRS